MHPPPRNANDVPLQDAAHKELSSPTPLAGYRNYDATATEPVGIEELDRRRREHHALRRLLEGAAA